MAAWSLRPPPPKKNRPSLAACGKMYAKWNYILMFNGLALTSCGGAFEIFIGLWYVRLLIETLLLFPSLPESSTTNKYLSSFFFQSFQWMSHVLPAVDSIHNVSNWQRQPVASVTQSSVTRICERHETCHVFRDINISRFFFFFFVFVFFVSCWSSCFYSLQVGIYCLCLVAPGGLPKVSWFLLSNETSQIAC